MGFGKFKFVNKDVFSELKKSLEDIKKENSTLKNKYNQFIEDINIEKSNNGSSDSKRLRTSIWDDPNSFMSLEDSVRVPNYPINEYVLLRVAYQSDILMTVINALRDGIFRRGHIIKEKVQIPDKNQSILLKSIIKKINCNNQTIYDLLKIFEQDLNILDDGYLVAIKDYVFGIDGDILHEETKEIIRASPVKLRIISDVNGNLGYNDNGEKLYVSPLNRLHLITESQARDMGFKDKNGIKLQRAYYRGESYLGNSLNYFYYLKDEVLHLSKHNPSLLYGYPPILSVWMKITTLLEQDRFLLLNYQKGRSPRGVLVARTPNYKSFEVAWEELKQKTRADPHSINPVAIETSDGKGGLDWIDLMKPLEDMQFIESRNEMRRQIGALYGVMPLFSGDLSQAGGLNNEGLQMVVTNKSIELGQKLYNERVFKWILKQFKITDYILELEEPEEKSEIEDQEVMSLKIDNAVKMNQMGFNVEYDQESGDFDYSGSAKTPEHEPFIPFQKSSEIVKENRSSYPFFEISKSPFFEIKNSGQFFSEIQKQDQTEEFVKFLQKQQFDRQYEDLTKTQSNYINDIIMEGILKRLSLREVINKIMNVGVDFEQAETIARTESGILKNTAKEFNLKKLPDIEDRKFKWIGPRDHRTSKISKQIKKDSKKGLPLDVLKKLVRKTSEEFGFEPKRDWFSHPNQRHTYNEVRR
jgi:hypothetical protein